jgi:hypothetical protein
MPPDGQSSREGVMENRYLGQINPDMDVCDVNGDKLGSVADVLRHEFAPAATMQGAASRPAVDVIEVKTGFLGMGKRLFIPISAVMDVTGGALFLSKARGEIDALGWDQPPEHLR